MEEVAAAHTRSRPHSSWLDIGTGMVSRHLWLTPPPPDEKCDCH